MNNNGYRTPTNPNGLIFPVIVHDGETLPVELSIIQRVEIQSCFNPRMCLDSPQAAELDDKLNSVADSIVKSIQNAPDWQNDWQIEAANQFYNQYYNKTGTNQTILPKFTS
jgi:hypothetical protein